MDPRDHPGPALDGATCAACDGPVSSGSIHLLARRDDLAFVQIDCGACRSSTLAFVLGDAVPGGPTAPVTSDDVLDMHRFLSAWQGGLRELLTSEPGAAAS